MKLQLSIWAENLKSSGFRQPDPFAVVTIVPKELGAKPEIIGKTEIVPNTRSPDWTKIFIINDFQIGKSMNLAVSIYNGETSEKNKPMGSALFEVGKVLGSPGSIMGKEIKGGGLVVASVESAHDAGSVRFRLRALDLINTEGVMRKPDPFFELQRLRESASRVGSRVWDTVFRSTSIKNTLNPIWGESFLELSALCGLSPNQKFRLALYDFEESGNHVFMGEAKLTIDELVAAVADDGMSDSVPREKELKLKNAGKDAGGVIVVEAEVTKPETASDEALPLGSQEPLGAADEEEYELAGSSEEITVDPLDMKALIAPTFANYVSGGCQLHVMVAIDATATNGDPRQPTSLHSFQGKNDYQTVLETTCRVLAKYDSDQLYPVYGFGAKIDGKIDHCFHLSKDEKSVSGVDGILSTYDEKFKSGLIMSTPRDFSEVIRKCTDASLEELENGHAYSILLLFTNGTPADVSKSVEALMAADEAPLSIVVVGIGGGDFAMDCLVAEGNGGRDKVRFVQYTSVESDQDALAAAALDHIPEQLETYFQSHNLYPNPEKAIGEIVVEPYNEATDVNVPIQISDNGDPVVTGSVDSQANNGATTSAAGETKMQQMMNHGQTFLTKHKKQVGKVTRKFNLQAKKEIKKKFPQAKFFL